MKYLPCNKIACPAADMGQTLRFREICLFASQLLSKQLLLGDVHRSADEPFEDSLFNDGHSHGANVAQLPVRSDYSLHLVEATVFLLHEFNRFSHGGAVLWMYEGQILFNRGCSVLRIQAVDFVQLVSPIVT